MAAGDVARVLDLLDRYVETLWSRGQYATLLKWLDELGDEAIRPRHRLRVHHALTSIMAGELSAGAARLRALESELAKKELGWQPETSFEEGVKRYIEWYKQEEEERGKEWAGIDEILQR